MQNLNDVDITLIYSEGKPVAPKTKTDAVHLSDGTILTDKIDSIESSLTNKSDITHNHDTSYYTKANTYNKTEVTTLIERSIQENAVDLTPYAKKIDLLTKADVNHEHEEYLTTLPAHNHDNMYYTKEQTFNKTEIGDLVSQSIDAIDLTPYAKKTDVDTKLQTKADINYVDEGLNTKSDIGHKHSEYLTSLPAHTHDEYLVEDDLTEAIDSLEIQTYAKLNYVDSQLVKKANISDVNEALENKSDIDHIHDQYLTELPKHGHDEYVSREELDEVVGNIDLSEYATKRELDLKADLSFVNSELENKSDITHTHEEYASKTDVNIQLQNKADRDHEHNEYALIEDLNEKADRIHNHNDIYYTKKEVDTAIDEKIGDINYDTFVTRDELDAGLSNKADKNHTHNQYVDISTFESALEIKSDVGHNHDSSYYTKMQTYSTSQVDELISNKVDQTYVDAELSKKANLEHSHDNLYYTKTYIDSSLSDKADLTYVNTELNRKVDKVVGKTLTSNDFTNDLKQKLESIEENANNYVHPNSHPASMITGLSKIATSGSYDDIVDAPNIPSRTSELVNDSNFTTKNYVDNLFDNLGTDEILGRLENVYTKDESNRKINEEIQKVVGGAPEALDTLYEISNALNGDPNFANTIINELSTKVSKVQGKDLSTNDFTNEFKQKLELLENYDDTGIRTELNKKANKTELDEALEGKSDIVHTHTEYMTKTEAQSELSKKANKLDVDEALLNKSDKTHKHSDLYYEKTQVYHKTELDGFLDTKSDTSHNHDGIYAKINTVYDKDTMDTMLTGKSDTNHNHNSSYYRKNETYNKEELDASLSSKSDTSHNHDGSYYKKNETLSKTEITAELLTKSDTTHNHDSSYYKKADVYNKEQIDETIIALNLEQYATKTDLNSKSDKNHTHDNYLTSLPEHNHDNRYYTQQQINTKLNDKADMTHSHTKAEIRDFPTRVSQFTNDADYATQEFVTEKIEESKRNSKFNFEYNADVECVVLVFK